MRTNFDDYTFRCSELGLLFTDAKDKEVKKAGELGATAQTALRKIWIRERYGRHEEMTSKYTEKGNFCEADSLSLYTQITGNLVVKNTERKYDDLINGECDLIDREIIVDAKSCWNLITFMEAGIKKGYKLQIQGYMRLWGKKEGKLCYCLNDTPEHLIHDEIRKLKWKFPAVDFDNNEEYLEAENQLIKNMTFGDIPAEDRIKMFEIPYEESFESELRIKVLKARE